MTAAPTFLYRAVSMIAKEKYEEVAKLVQVQALGTPRTPRSTRVSHEATEACRQVYNMPRHDVRISIYSRRLLFFGLCIVL